MALTTKQIRDLNRSSKAAKEAELGSAVCVRKLSETVTRSQFTDDGAAAGHFDTSMVIPAGATFLYSAVTSVTAFAGNTSAAMTIGTSGDADRYMTSTIDVFTTAAGGLSAGAPSGTVYHSSDATVRITVTGATDFTAISAGSVTISVYYLD